MTLTVEPPMALALGYLSRNVSLHPALHQDLSLPISGLILEALGILSDGVIEGDGRI